MNASSVAMGDAVMTGAREKMMLDDALELISIIHARIILNDNNLTA